MNAIQQEFASFWRFYLNKNRSFLDNPLFLDVYKRQGEGFFLQSPDKDSFISLCRIFREQLVPLLEKWFDGDIERIRYVLGLSLIHI